MPNVKIFKFKPANHKMDMATNSIKSAVPRSGCLITITNGIMINDIGMTKFFK